MRDESFYLFPGPFLTVCYSPWITIRSYWKKAGQEYWVYINIFFFLYLNKDTHLPTHQHLYHLKTEAVQML